MFTLDNPLSADAVHSSLLEYFGCLSFSNWLHRCTLRSASCSRWTTRCLLNTVTTTVDHNSWHSALRTLKTPLRIRIISIITNDAVMLQQLPLCCFRCGLVLVILSHIVVHQIPNSISRDFPNKLPNKLPVILYFSTLCSYAIYIVLSVPI